MPAAVVDTTVLIDYKDTGSRDRHERATAIVEGIDAGELPTGHVTNYVLLETLNWIHTRQRHDIAVDLRRRLAESAGFELRHAARTDYHRAVELFGTHGNLSFGDATIAAYMEREDVDVLYSFDGDFDAVGGVTRLDTAGDPTH